MAMTANLGFPRIGAHRELKKALETYWKGESSDADLMTVAKGIREENWKRQRDAGIEHIPCNDFALYDQVLDHIQMFGCIPSRYEALKENNPLTLSFAMARGHQADGVDVVAMEMTKWFDTNYHYIVPEFSAKTRFALNADNVLAQVAEAKALGITPCPVIIGPLSFLSLGKVSDSEHAEWTTLREALVPCYEALLQKLQAAGVEWVQIDEPFLAMDICEGMQAGYKAVYETLAAASDLKICLTTYFDALHENTQLTFGLPVDAVHVDLVRAPDQLDACLAAVKDGQMLSLGVIDGRNIWKSDLAKAQAMIAKAEAKLGADRVMIAPSCSLLHTPVDLDNEAKLDDEIKNWLAFAQQKLEEIGTLKTDDAAALAANAAAMKSRAESSRIHNDAVKSRSASVDDAMRNRKTKFDDRIALQEANLKLPPLPTTTIGSFTQTKEVRQARAKFKKGELSATDYQAFLEQATTDCIQKQEAMGIDVLVHGEFERNDMVEYFGEQLDGFTFSSNGWVQSYGSRCVKPPIIFGDVSRPKPMTVDWAKYAQSQTEAVMKGMLTGPVTILQWSFVRDDQPRSETCKQIALAIRDEVVDLEQAGIQVIQIDEAALREGLPLRRADWKHYLDWAVDAFRISASGVNDTTQIHTHMCYSEFNDIIEAVAKMDADVISIETSRSAMELLDAFVKFKYPNQIGPGVYDIHSPRIPSQNEMEALLKKALEVLKPEQIWVNPDCGLKTRGWAEVTPALEAMVAATKSMRAQLGESAAA
jgi:5-methyltetrahydropteroyltriglutamate--homocysteine methyltransferase